MKTKDKSVNSKRIFFELISKLSANEILDLSSMLCIRGGDPDGNGSTIILPPPVPK
jgi:hypothetical protein